ncbi:putative ferric-chelate reductase 1 isoform X1 [Scophthalmus maximus]|uniref:putative ferric-chelate reductase 1 isoform X1 n=1 Tax=Scophthalmus maximus TaxID=52904 RepID=UPI001FA93BE5|nr:putative ferric-chelate reductase 1 isoform X1 [Scophthalmus maximus]
MERGAILLVAAVVVFVAPVVRGTSHLSFANDTQQVNVTRAGCGVTALCVDQPGACDPAGNGTCLFASVVAGPPAAPNGTDLYFKLRGTSKGYVALGLAVNATEGTSELFLCGQNSSHGTFFFRTMQRNNTNAALTPAERRVTQIRGLVRGDVIECEFNVPGVNATDTRSSHATTTFSILLGTGPLNGSTLGPFNVSLISGPLNVADPSSNVPTTPSPATNATATATATPSGASSVLLSHALLLLPSVLALSVTQSA